MDKINDNQPLVTRGFNYDTLTRYISRTVRSPLVSYLIVNALSNKYRSGSIEVRKRLAAAAALWAATNVVLPGLCSLTAKIFGKRDNSVYWPNEIVVVTGGSHGVGNELTLRLLKAGAQVVILDVNPFVLDDERYKSKWHYYQLDVTNVDQTKEVAEQIRNDVGYPTMLVNNAGIVDKVINVNLTSHFHLIRQFLPGMIKAQRGHIVTIGSIVSFAGTPQATTYCASKGGVKLLHESLRREVASRYGASNIKFSIAYPGVIDTGLFKGLNLGQFFMPNLKPHAIARSVFSALAAGEGRDIYLPKAAGMLPLIYMLTSGGDTAMATWSGHTKY
ncbi:NAD(P)-binding protein [Linderina pennispora]|uniref:NAD(P)-binding protein n=1 Tax=Linderina pennispora TaxID=61395 RepID=A0A1Y1W211_9FUNG|nr:NAD(P)-binding protein [Linderina pennispora]ORX67154.1 NAD(P)-binding protein [Linderina pennispora]